MPEKLIEQITALMNAENTDGLEKVLRENAQHLNEDILLKLSHIAKNSLIPVDNAFRSNFERMTQHFSVQETNALTGAYMNHLAPPGTSKMVERRSFPEKLSSLAEEGRISKSQCDDLTALSLTRFNRTNIEAILSCHLIGLKLQNGSKESNLLAQLSSSFTRDKRILFAESPGRHILRDPEGIEKQFTRDTLVSLSTYIQNRSQQGYIIEPWLASISAHWGIPEMHPEFRGWALSAKTGGKEFGFILTHPTQDESWYFKTTNNEVSEWFLSNYLINIGIKYPESRLLIDPVGTLFLATRNMTRHYDNGGVEKKKSFQTFAEILKDSSLSAIKRQMEKFESPNAHTERRARAEEEDLLKSRFSTRDVHHSFAKILIAGLIFGLSDLGGHWGNLGITDSASRKKGSYAKIGLIDFQTAPINDETLNATNLLDKIRQNNRSLDPIFVKMANMLSDQEIFDALDDLLTPKERTHSNGLLLQKAPMSRISIIPVINHQFEIMCGELRAMSERGMHPAEIHTATQRVNAEHVNIIQNIERIRKCYLALKQSAIDAPKDPNPASSKPR